MVGRKRMDVVSIRLSVNPLKCPRPLPCFLSAALTCAIASHGDGKSRNTASATWSSPKPSEQTSLCLAVTRSRRPWSSNSSAAFKERCSWKSKVWRWPEGAMVRIMACDRDPLPVPKMEEHDNNLQYIT